MIAYPSLYLNVPVPVSYTHLDVYKRQILTEIAATYKAFLAEYNAVFRIAVYLLVFKLSQAELIICIE